MMDKLTLQTVYVPVEGDLDNHPGLCIWTEYEETGGGGWEYKTDLNKQDNRIVLTKHELGQILLDALILASEGMPMSIDGKNQLVNQFMKSKGIEI